MAKVKRAAKTAKPRRATLCLTHSGYYEYNSAGNVVKDKRRWRWSLEWEIDRKAYVLYGKYTCCYRRRSVAVAAAEREVNRLNLRIAATYEDAEGVE